MTARPCACRSRRLTAQACALPDMYPLPPAIKESTHILGKHSTSFGGEAQTCAETTYILGKHAVSPGTGGQTHAVSTDITASSNVDFAGVSQVLSVTCTIEGKSSVDFEDVSAVCAETTTASSGAILTPGAGIATLAERVHIITRSKLQSNEQIVRQPYAAIVDLAPDFFVQFAHPVWYGKQVLWRDPECTQPVTEPNQHTIGGVTDPFTDAVLLTQNKPASRPLWGGEEVGAIFDGIDDYFDSEFDGLGDEFSQFVSYGDIPDPSSHLNMVSGGSLERAFGLNTSVSGERFYLNTDDSSEERIGTYVLNQDGHRAVAGGKVWAPEGLEVVGGDGETNSDLKTNYFGDRGTLRVGARRTTYNYAYEGSIQWVFCLNRLTTRAEELILRTAT